MKGLNLVYQNFKAKRFETESQFLMPLTAVISSVVIMKESN